MILRCVAADEGKEGIEGSNGEDRDGQEERPSLEEKGSTRTQASVSMYCVSCVIYMQYAYNHAA